MQSSEQGFKIDSGPDEEPLLRHPDWCYMGPSGCVYQQPGSCILIHLLVQRFMSDSIYTKHTKAHDVYLLNTLNFLISVNIIKISNSSILFSCSSILI